MREIHGVTVETDHDDIFVGYKGFNYWYELKNPNTVSKKTGKVNESKKQKSQKRLAKEWKGHYRVVHSIDQILDEILKR